MEPQESSNSLKGSPIHQQKPLVAIQLATQQSPPVLLNEGQPDLPAANKEKSPERDPRTETSSEVLAAHLTVEDIYAGYKSWNKEYMDEHARLMEEFSALCNVTAKYQIACP